MDQGGEQTGSLAEYAHLEPLLAEYARLDDADPDRSRLRERLVTEFLPLAHHIARHFTQRGVPMEDLVQLASLGLVQAIRRYDPTRGSGFLAFAVPTMQGEIRRYFRDRTWSMRVPRRLKELCLAINASSGVLAQRLGRAPRPSEIASYLGVPTEEVLEGLAAGGAYTARSLDRQLEDSDLDASVVSDLLGAEDPELDRIEFHQSLQPLLDELPDRERAIVLMRFFGDMSQTQIAERFGVSQMQISRLLAKTLAELRAQLETA